MKNKTKVNPYLMRALSDADFHLCVLLGFLPDEVLRDKVDSIRKIIIDVYSSLLPKDSDKDAKEDKKSAE